MNRIRNPQFGKPQMIPVLDNRIVSVCHPHRAMEQANGVNPDAKGNL
jgi:hypothetical protein